MTTKTRTGIDFHISFDVRDLDASVAFYRDLLGTEPDKRHGDYARFTLDAPPLVLSLVAGRGGAAPAGRQRVSHLGFRVDSPEALATARERLASAGRELREEPGSRCCYAVQDKFWVADPDGNEWEFYQLLDDIPTRGEDMRGCCT